MNGTHRVKDPEWKLPSENSQAITPKRELPSERFRAEGSTRKSPSERSQAKDRKGSYPSENSMANHTQTKASKRRIPSESYQAIVYKRTPQAKVSNNVSSGVQISSAKRI